MSKQQHVIDLIQAFGKQDFVIDKSKDETQAANYLLVNGLWTAGRYFAIVSNIHTWDIELISGDCLNLTGYQKEEIEAMKARFLMDYATESDLPFYLSAVKLGMQYIIQRLKEERELIYAVYFYRAQKKNGQIIVIQQQKIPVLFDANKVPYVFNNIFTDISYLGSMNLPKAIMVNRFTDEIFSIQPQHLRLVKATDLFSNREKEVIQLLINGNNSRQIGKLLHISIETVRTHRKNILNKAKLKTTTELVSYALTHGVV